MTEPRAGPLTRVAGNLALDFVNTVSWQGTAQEVDHLRTVELLLTWVHESAAVQPAPGEPTVFSPVVFDAASLSRLQRSLRSKPESGARLLSSALQLRSAIAAVGAAVATHAAPDRNRLETVKQAAIAALVGGRIAPVANQSFGFDFSGAGPEAAVLGPIAWSAIDLLRSDLLDRVKQCPATDCRWLFLDTTRNGSRRWCDMATCGNRSKAKRFRQDNEGPQ